MDRINVILKNICNVSFILLYADDNLKELLFANVKFLDKMFGRK
ncbi:hypothetical protein Bmyc01_39170 [Bacillus mycoides]|nr:hypothetical protein Bmyc01_39170 [Bacillus mycoides]